MTVRVDRFEGEPEIRERAERRMKRINAAYARIKSRWGD